MKADKYVSKKIYLISIVLTVLSVLLCIYAVFKEEYIIAVAMVAVMLLQVNNVLNYRKQQSRKGQGYNNKGRGHGKGRN